jgi:Mn-dependent DtxR family transcriptional regulator
LFYNRSMSTLPLEEKRNKLILALYELHTTKGPRVDIYELEKHSGLERQEFYDMIRQLGRTQKGWLIKSNERVSITSEGTEKAEELLKMQMVEKERLVLKKIYDLGGPTHMDWVPIDKLRKELGMPSRELNAILLDFERRKGWVEGPDEAVGLTPAGVREVENPGGDTRGVGLQFKIFFKDRSKVE